MTYLPWLIGVLAVLLLVWLAWRRPNRQRLFWRVVASAVAGISAVLLLFPPSFQKAIDPGTAILLTEGYHTDSLEHLLNKLQAEPMRYTYKTTDPDAAPLSELYSLRQRQPEVQAVHVLGYGLAQQELAALAPAQIIPHLTPLPAGVAAVHWPETVKAGEAVEVSGRYKNNSTAKATVYLQAAGQLQDSATVAPDSTHAFRLRYTPKQAGRYTYRLLAKAAAGTDTLGQVPVQVAQPDKLRVLLLASAPMFEFKFLKEHLAQLQHAVALRTTVSKGISRSEWLNMPQTNLDKLTPKLLEAFDVVILEPQALQSLSVAERNSLQRAVSEQGLGVLTLAAEQPANNRSTAFFTTFRTRRVGQQETRQARAAWASGATGAVTALPYSFLKEEAVLNIVEEQDAQLLTAGKKAGWGTVAMTAVPQTFSWQLEGKGGTYSSYWAHVLSAVARKETAEKFWTLDAPKVPQPHQPLTLTYTDYTLPTAAAPPAATIVSVQDSAETAVAMAQHPLQPEKYSATYWPQRTGWHRAQAPDAAPFYFYVQDSADWAFAPIQARQQATQQFVAQQNADTASYTTTYKAEQVPLVWFFVLFVLSSSFLWLEEKL